MRNPLGQFEPSEADVARQDLNTKSLLQRLGDAQNELGLRHIAAVVRHDADIVRLSMTLKQFEGLLVILEAAAMQRTSGDQVHQQGKLFE